MAYLGTTPNTGENRKLDDISGSFNGSTTTFDLQVDSSDVYPGTATALLISVGGVVQEPKTAYTLASNGKQITFATAPATSEDFFGVVLGQAIDVGTPADDAITTAKIADDAVTTAKIADRAVTQAKLAESSVGGSKVRANVLSSGSIYTANIAGNAYVTRGFAVGYTDGRVPQANLDVKGNVAVSDTVLVVQSGGNIGMGTASPTFPNGGGLHIYKSDYPRVHLTNDTTGSTDGDGFFFTGVGLDVYHENKEAGSQIFTIGGNEKVRIDSSGQLGVGASSPTALLDVAGDFALTKSAQAQVRVAGVIGGTGQTTTGTNSYQNTSPQFDFANAQNWRITLANNVTFGRPWNCNEGQTGSIFVGQDGVGSRTGSFSDDWLFPAGTAPTLTTTASANDRIDYIVQKVHHGGQAVGIQAVVTLDLK